MREVQTAHLFVFLLILIPVAASADPGCTCAIPNRPCTEETLAAASVPQTVPATSDLPTVELTMQECWDCGNGADLVGGFVMSLLLLPIVLTIKRLRRSGPIVARFDLMSKVRDAYSGEPCDSQVEGPSVAVPVARALRRSLLLCQPAVS